MSEILPQIRPSFNRSLRIQTRPERLSADTGALAQREMMDRTGIISGMAARGKSPDFSDYRSFCNLTLRWFIDVSGKPKTSNRAGLTPRRAPRAEVS